MNKTALLITTLSAVLSISGPALAKGKGQDKEKHQSQSRMENANKQSLEDSRRAQERAEQRHDMRDQEEYGQPNYRIENPVDTLIDRSADQLKSGAQDLNRRAIDSINQGGRDLASPPPPQPRRR